MHASGFSYCAFCEYCVEVDFSGCISNYIVMHHFYDNQKKTYHLPPSILFA